jgi:hypothetical protein
MNFEIVVKVEERWQIAEAAIESSGVHNNLVFC